MTFLGKVARYLISKIKKMFKAVDRYLSDAEFTYEDETTGKELTSPLIEIAIRRAVSAVILAVGTALDARIPKESLISVPVYDTFTRLSNETWHGGFK